MFHSLLIEFYRAALIILTLLVLYAHYWNLQHFVLSKFRLQNYTTPRHSGSWWYIIKYRARLSNLSIIEPNTVSTMCFMTCHLRIELYRECCSLGVFLDEVDVLWSEVLKVLYSVFWTSQLMLLGVLHVRVLFQHCQRFLVHPLREGQLFNKKNQEKLLVAITWHQKPISPLVLFRTLYVALIWSMENQSKISVLKEWSMGTAAGNFRKI